jgi:hypothetical protein
MKITKSQLKRIIKEEIKKLLKEDLDKWEKDSPAYKPPGISKWLPWRQDDIADAETKHAKQLDLEEQIRNVIEEFDSIASADTPDWTALFDLSNTALELYQQLPYRKGFISDETDRLASVANDHSKLDDERRDKAQQRDKRAEKERKAQARRDAASSYTPSRSSSTDDDDDYDPEFKVSYMHKRGRNPKWSNPYAREDDPPQYGDRISENKLTKGALKRIIREEIKRD